MPIRRERVEQVLRIRVLVSASITDRVLPELSKWMGTPSRKRSGGVTRQALLKQWPARVPSSPAVPLPLTI